ncbi:MAG: metal-dependent transcriptional regulator [Thermofilaceae archaeon]
MPVEAEDYLALLYRLQELGIEPRLSMVARELGVRPVTAAKGLARLSAKGLVEKSGLGYELTPLGFERAVRVVRNHRIIERFLADVMQVDSCSVHELAHSLEHVEGFAEIVDDRLGRPTLCPHGNPVPGRASVEALPLSRVCSGVYRVARIGELGGSLRWACAVGLRLNDRIEVEGFSGRSVVVRYGGARYDLPLSVTSFIFVRRV